MIYLTIWIPIIIESIKKYFSIRIVIGTNKREIGSIQLILFWILCSLIMGFRSIEVGIDTPNYYYLCNQVSITPWTEIFRQWYTWSMEIGYCVLIKLTYSIVNSYYFSQMVISFIYNYFIIRFIKKYSLNLSIACVVFLGMGFYLMAFNITRQMLAVSLIAYAFENMAEKRYLRYFMIIFVATSIHTSAIIGLFFVPVYIIKNHYKFYRVIMLLIIFTAINYQSIVLYIKSKIKKYYFLSAGSEYTYGYIRIVWGIIGVLSVLLFYRSMQLMRKSDLIGFNFVFQNNDQNDIKKSIWINMVVAISSIIYVVCYIIGSRFQYIERIGLFFSSFVIVIFDRFAEICLINKNIKKLFYLLVSLSFFVLFLLSIREGQYYYKSYL